MNEGPPPDEMIPGLRNLIARMEGFYIKDDPKEDQYMIPDGPVNSDRLDNLAMMLVLNDHIEQVKKLEEDLSNSKASVGFLTILSLAQIIAIVYLFASR